MKYPFALVNKLIDIYGPDLALAYDIMCGCMKSLKRSSLGPKVDRSRLHGIVPAFHGHAHNHGCQVHWHPMYMEGAGIEDFEECERMFTKSNELAPGTRLATPFHRHQQINEHFKFHDEDKYAASGMCLIWYNEADFDRDQGNFIFQNYRQALTIIHDDSVKLNRLSCELNTGPADYEEYLESEREYLRRLKTEPSEVIETVTYMEALIKLEGAS